MVFKPEIAVLNISQWWGHLLKSCGFPMTRLPILDYICLSPCRETPTIRHQSRLYMEKKSSRNHQPVYHTMLCECSHLAIELSTLVNLIRSLSIWAVFKIPLSFHSTGCFIGIPLLDYYNPQFLLRIFIPQLIINPARGGSQPLMLISPKMPPRNGSCCSFFFAAAFRSNLSFPLRPLAHSYDNQWEETNKYSPHH